MNKIILIIIIVLIAVMAGYFILRGESPAPAPESATSNTPAPGNIRVEETLVIENKEIEEEEAVIPETKETAAIKKITVMGTEFAFSPSKINLLAGEKVKLTFQNNGRAPHNLVIDGLNIRTSVIGGGETEIIEFKAPVLGTYSFICSVPGHRPAGMEGLLLVE